MINELLVNYGHAIIPKNTLLFRGSKSSEIEECMFLALTPTIASAFDETVQVWKIVNDVQLIFLIDHIDHGSNSFSSIPLLYKHIFPEEESNNYDDLDIKMHIELRNKLFRSLNNDYEIPGWLTSVENDHHLEICFFDKTLLFRDIKLIELTNAKNDKYFIDTLKKIKIFPTQSFFIKSHLAIRQNSYYDCDDLTKWKKYKKFIDYCIKGESKSPRDIKWNKMYWSNLRTKLKI